jgi:dihydroorotate dehydrogenase (NAD+) catalytic subunit
MIEVTLARKNSIVVESPVLLGAGTVGYDGSPYRQLLALDKFGALVTAPMTLAPRFPAHGVRVVPLPAGFLLHTGLPNPGVKRVIQEYQPRWQRSVLPVIAHVMADTPHEMEQLAHSLDRCEAVSGIEIALEDGLAMREARDLLLAARYHCDLPILVKLPLHNALLMSEVAHQAEMDALVVAAAPRGTERAPKAGRLIGGRLYGPWLKALTLRLVGRIAQYAEMPIIGVGGIHSADDARDFIAAGARAVQLDTVVWVNPKGAEAIAVNLGGGELTRTSGALVDEWTRSTGAGRAAAPPPPSHLPELGSHEEDITQHTPPSNDPWND